MNIPPSKAPGIRPKDAHPLIEKTANININKIAYLFDNFITLPLRTYYLRMSGLTSMYSFINFVVGIPNLLFGPPFIPEKPGKQVSAFFL